MNDLREQIAEIFDIRARNIVAWERSQEDLITEYQWADTILALIPKPTVRVKCGECGGPDAKYWYGVCPCGWHGTADKASGGGPLGDTGDFCDVHCPACDREDELEQGPCPSCTDGWNEHEIVLERELPPCGPNPARVSSTLTLPDLIDPDVACAYCEIHENARLNHWADEEIPNNKGTLRIGEAIKG